MSTKIESQIEKRVLEEAKRVILAWKNSENKRGHSTFRLVSDNKWIFFEIILRTHEGKYKEYSTVD